jgi:hypothetical protein
MIDIFNITTNYRKNGQNWVFSNYSMKINKFSQKLISLPETEVCLKLKRKNIIQDESFWMTKFKYQLKWSEIVGLLYKQ